MKLIYKYLVFVILFLPILYVFSWLHEGGHIFGAILSGNEVIRIDVGILGGEVHAFYYNYPMKWLICIMGSISTLIISIPLMIYSIKKKNMYVFFIGFIQTAKEVLYWGITPFMKYGDAYSLINWAVALNLDVLIVVIKITGIIFLIITICLFIMSIYYCNKWLYKLGGKEGIKKR